MGGPPSQRKSQRDSHDGGIGKKSSATDSRLWRSVGSAVATSATFRSSWQCKRRFPRREAPGVDTGRSEEERQVFKWSEVPADGHEPSGLLERTGAELR